MDAGVDESRIAVMSFTRAAAQEIARRAGTLGVEACTLHSMAFRLCELSRTQVVDRAKLREFSRVSKIETTGANIYEQERLERGDNYLSMLNYSRATGNPDRAEIFRRFNPPEGNPIEFTYFTRAYREWKAAYGFVDFADMIDDAVGVPGPDLDLLLLDEAQDFSPAQWRLIEHWLPTVREVVLALDDDQAIHTFSGADPRGGPTFEARCGSDRVVLGQSYRLPARIHGMAQRLIARAAHRVPKEFQPRAEGGDIRIYGSLNLVPIPDPEEDVLVLFRNHSLRRHVEEWLIGRRIPFVTSGGYPGPLDGRWAKAIDIWKMAQRNHERSGMMMLTNPQMAALTSATSGMGERLLLGQIHRPWHQVLHIPTVLCSYLRALESKYGTHRPETKIRLSTIHGAKGWEADRVILLNAMGERTAEAYASDPESEIRVFYVGVTRARHTLDVVNGDNPMPGLR